MLFIFDERLKKLHQRILILDERNKKWVFTVNRVTLKTPAMERNHFAGIISTISIICWIFISPVIALATDPPQLCNDKCINCFSTQLIEITKNDNCIRVTLQINAGEGCKYALSHFMVAIPCGKVTQANNSGNWPMEFMVTDPTTGIKGLKVDNIRKIGKDGKPGSFTVTFTVCSSSSNCIKSIENGTFKVAYKASTCVFYEYVKPEVVPVPLTASIEANAVTCFGSTDGRVSTLVSGGIAPYSYLWSNGATTSAIENVAAGNYSVLVFDAMGSEINMSATVLGPSQIVISGQLTPALCAQSNGAINITVSGGNGDYSYSWAHGPLTEDVSGLTSGSYQVTVTDSNGCISKMPFFISSKSPIKATSVANTLDCHEKGKGIISLNTWGGSEPYTFVWSNGATTQNLEGLNVGTYRVTITDAEGCKLEHSVSVSQKVFYVSAAVSQADCSNEGGSVVLNPQNGTGPYIAEWSNGLTGMQINNLTPGSYMVLVTDANGCRINQQVNISGSEGFTLNASVATVGCNAQNSKMVISINATGGTPPYAYWVNGVISGSTFETSQEGDYVIIVTDSKGCSTTKTVSVTRQSATLSVHASVTGPTCDQPQSAIANITISNGTAPFTILWNGIEGGLTKSDLVPGNYVVKVIDAYGCEANTSFVVKGITIPSVKIIAPPENPECSSHSNFIGAQVTHVDSYYWVLNSETQNWIITSETINQIVYKAGSGDATLVLVVKSPDGCEAIDYIDISCTNAGNNNDDDDHENPESCLFDCVKLEKTEVSNSGNGCVRYELTFVTNGNCRYELSHLVVDLGGAYATNVSNSRNWKMEINTTDPKSGLTGIKVDDISRFGKIMGDRFTVKFELCNAVGFDPSKILVAYKAGNCLDIVNAKPKIITKDKHINCKVYSGRSKSDTYFEFNASVETFAELNLYTRCGIPVTKLFKGRLSPGVTYKVKYSGGKGDDMIMFYKLETGFKVLDGKVIRLK